MRKKLKVALVAAVIVVALGLAGLASGIWQQKSIKRDGTWKAVSGTYFDTPEEIDYAQISGPCSNIRAAIRAVGDNLVAPGTIIWQDPIAHAGCPLAHVITTIWTYGHLPDYPGGVYIAVVGGPADGQTIGVTVNGVQH